MRPPADRNLRVLHLPRSERGRLLLRPASGCLMEEQDTREGAGGVQRASPFRLILQIGHAREATTSLAESLRATIWQRQNTPWARAGWLRAPRTGSTNWPRVLWPGAPLARGCAPRRRRQLGSTGRIEDAIWLL